ncbi:MAG: T9SS type A sorting domain-containing protein [Bacteroidota bacterium]|nr:T9SS type A sorting domain-containing protein [Bacteroidota bacterium]
MKKLLLIAAALGICSGVYAKKVKFQVDMTGQTVGSNGVHIAGNFQAAAGASGDWMPAATAMLNGGSGNIYSVIVDIPAKARYEFKFINGNDWPGAESVPTLSQVGSAINGGSNGNRWFHVDSIANDTTVIPAIKFSSEAPAGKYAIRFAVDMQKEASVSSNGVHIAGSIQGWDPTKTSMSNLFNNNKIYEYIAYLDSGSYEFKYVNGNAWGSDESVPSACNVGGNRGVLVNPANGSRALAKVCFAMCVACPSAPIPTYAVKFMVDMSNTDCDGGFDSVTVAGAGAALTNFGAGIKLAAIGTSKIYTTTITLDSGEINYKFRYHKNNNTNWEGGDNRLFAVKKIDTIPLYCFNSRTIGNCPTKPAPSAITFKVDLTKETPDPQGRIYVEGTFQTPNWQAGAVRMAAVPGLPGVYSVTINNVCPGVFNYKFMNGDSSVGSSEETYPDTTQRGCLEPSGVGGFNRKYTRIAATPVTLYYVYNSCKVSTVSVNDIASLTGSMRMYPNPTSTYTVVEFNDNANTHQINIMDIAGRVVRSYANYKFNTLRIDKEELTPGLYFVNVSNDKNQTGTVKLLID